MACALRLLHIKYLLQLAVLGLAAPALLPHAHAAEARTSELSSKAEAARAKSLTAKVKAKAMQTQAALLQRQPGTCGDDFHGEPLPVLRLERRWESGLDRSGHHITIVTQGSLDRVGMLQLSCRMWGSVIALVIYAPLVDGRVLVLGEPRLTLPQVIQHLTDLHAAFEEHARCILDIALYSEEKSEGDVGLYPVNSLRNRALMLASTEAVLLLDFDFLVSRGGAEAIRYGVLRRHLLKKQAIVLPAFESTQKAGRRAEAAVLASVRGGKAQLAERVESGSMQQFLVSYWPLAQDATNHSAWFDTEDLYRIRYTRDYEPYVIVARKGLPWYDERFKGYYQDKVMHLLTMNAAGYKYVVHPTAFVVHYPHKVAIWRETAEKAGLRKTYNALAGHIKQQQANGTYLPAIMLACRNATADPAMMPALAELSES